MHSLLQKMGRGIVKKESLKEPGKREFLWSTSEIIELLDKNTVSLFLLHMQGKIQISKSAFDEMNNLQFLKVKSDNVRIPEGLNCLPDKLRLIHWDNCPLRFWPSKFSAKFLVELIMRSNKFEKLWEGIKPLHCLKLIDLSISRYLKEIPDLSEAMSLEKLDLTDCESLLELTSSIGNATKLRVYLGYSMVALPSSISTWSCLYKLDMSGLGFNFFEPASIRDFPNVPDSIVELVLSFTGIEEVPPWIEKLFRLRKLIMNGCEKLKKISPKVSKLENLELLFLSFCDILLDGDYDSPLINCYDDIFEAKIEWGPDLKRSLKLISDFNIDDILPICLPEKALKSSISVSLRGDCFKTIPYCIRSLRGLSKLDMTNCRNLVALPPLPGSLLSIVAHDYRSLEIIDSSSFQNPNICLNFAKCFNLNQASIFYLNQKARKIIETSACKYALLPGIKVPAHFIHRASSGSLTINLSPKSLPSPCRFRACILVPRDSRYYSVPESSLSCSVSGKQNDLTVEYGSNQLHHMPGLEGCREHLYIFEDSFCLNQDCFEAEETTSSKLSFVFRFHDEDVKIKGCGVQLLFPHCITDKNADDYNDEDGDGDETDDDDDGEEQEYEKNADNDDGGGGEDESFDDGEGTEDEDDEVGDGDNDDVEDDVDTIEDGEESGRNEDAETRRRKRKRLAL
ncbi:unnamed protein product [Brassica oleracea]